MARTELKFEDEGWLDIWDDIEPDLVDEFPGGNHIQNKYRLVHSPDVEIEYDGYKDDFQFGVQWHQYSTQDEIDRITDEEYMVNKDGDGDNLRHHLEEMRRWSDE